MQKRVTGILITSIVIVYIFISIFVSVSNDKVNEARNNKIINIDSVTLIENGGEKSISLPHYIDVDTKAVLKASLNYSFSENTSPTLIMQANHSFMTFFLNGEQIYKVGEKDYSLGNYFARVPLPQSIENGILTIEISVPEKGLRHIQALKIVLGDEAQYIKNMIYSDLPSLILNLLILFCGMLMLLLALLDRKYLYSSKMLLRALLAINCAVYFMCETRSVVYLINAPRLIYYLDMLSFGMLSAPLLVLFAEEMSGWRKKFLQAVASAGILNVLAQLFFAAMGFAELRVMLTMTHITHILSGAAVFICLAYNIIKKQRSNILFTGLLIVIGGTVDFLMFITENNSSNVFFLKIALIAYFIHQLGLFIGMLMEQSAEKAREIYYKALALQDPMTRCYSRAAFEIDKQEWKNSAPRTVFFLDLNNLKAVNDQFGHKEGDRLIAAFGEILSEAFNNIGKCYRVGGDEFWVFCDKLPKGKAEEMVISAAKSANLYNTSNNTLAPLKYAVGFADTIETEGNLDEAIRLADERMYSDKRIAKGTKVS